MFKFVVQKIALAILMLLTFAAPVFAQVSTDTSCIKNGSPVPWYECLSGSSGSGGGKSIELGNFPVSFYQTYYEENGKDDEAFNKTVRRIIWDGLFIFISVLILGFIVVIILATIERTSAEDNEDKLKKAKKRINAAVWGLVTVVIFMLIGSIISVLTGTGALWDVTFFR